MLSLSDALLARYRRSRSSLWQTNHLILDIPILKSCISRVDSIEKQTNHNVFLTQKIYKLNCVYIIWLQTLSNLWGRSIIDRANEHVRNTTALKKCKLHKNSWLITFRGIKLHWRKAKFTTMSIGERLRQ